MDNLLKKRELGVDGARGPLPGSLVRAMGDRVREAPDLQIYREEGPASALGSLFC